MRRLYVGATFVAVLCGLIIIAACTLATVSYAVMKTADVMGW